MKADEFLAVAKNLQMGTREAEWRSAVSRAYYAAFCKAREQLRGEGVDEQTLRSHWRVWKTFRSATESQRSLIAANGEVLKEYRQGADYKNSLDRLPDTVQDSIKTARELLGSLEGLAASRR